MVRSEPAKRAEIGAMPGHLTLFCLVKDGLFKVCLARKMPPLTGRCWVFLMMPKEYWAQQGGNGFILSKHLQRVPGNPFHTALLLHQNAVGRDVLRCANPPLKK